MQQSGCHQQRKKHELSQGWIPKGHLNPWPSQRTIQETPLHVMHEYGSHPVQCPLTLCRKDEDLHAKRTTSRVLRIRCCSPQTSTSSRTLAMIHDLVRVEDETGRHRCCNVLFNSGWVLFLVTGGIIFARTACQVLLDKCEHQRLPGRFVRRVQVPNCVLEVGCHD